MLNKPSAQRDQKGLLTITISEDAVKHIKEFGKLEGKKDTNLRVGVKGGGCSGLTYVLELAESAKDNVPFHSIIFPATLIGTGKQYNLVNRLNNIQIQRPGSELLIPNKKCEIEENEKFLVIDINNILLLKPYIFLLITELF